MGELVKLLKIPKSRILLVKNVNFEKSLSSIPTEKIIREAPTYLKSTKLGQIPQLFAFYLIGKLYITAVRSIG